MSRIIIVVGPTASGKSALALQLASDFNGEIINADSRQVYRFMDIGTAKPTKEDQAIVPHHLIDIINPDQPFSLALYQSSAYRICKDIEKRNKVPLLVGGTGQYIWSTLEGWVIPDVPPDTGLRRELEKSADEKGSAFLYEELRKMSPLTAKKVDPNNTRRIIRAIEILRTKTSPDSVLWRKEPPDCSMLVIGLTMKREQLYKKIDERVDDMIEKGFVDEVKNLLGMGYSQDLPSLSGIGYRQICMVLQGQWTLDMAVEKIKYRTHEFARRQYNWFRPGDVRIHWFDVYDNIKERINDLVGNFLHESE
jgi:tRNA dimethylallyltransferase